MLVVGRALMARPRLMLLDEPSLGLAPAVIGDLFVILKRISSEEKATLLIAEQNAAARRRDGIRGGPGTRNSALPAQPKILDFGVSRIVAFNSPFEADSRPRFIGTPEYASPEQLAGRLDDVQPRCDVYSLGLIAHELLAGALPTRDMGRLQIDLRRIRLDAGATAEPLLERQFRHDVARVLSAALQRNPAVRLASAGPFGRELQQIHERFAPPTSGWGAIKNRLKAVFTTTPDWKPNAIAGALRIVVRSRVAAAIRGQIDGT